MRTYVPSELRHGEGEAEHASADHGRYVVEGRVVPFGRAGRSDREPVVDVLGLVLLRPLSGRLRVLLHSGRAAPPVLASTMIAVLDSARVQPLCAVRGTRFCLTERILRAFLVGHRAFL